MQNKILEALGAKCVLKSTDILNSGVLTTPAKPGEQRVVNLSSNGHQINQGDLLGYIPSDPNASLQLWKLDHIGKIYWQSALPLTVTFVQLANRQ
jgi:hypothetical protein